MVIDLSNIPIEELKEEMRRRSNLASDESKIRIILKKLSESEMEFLETSIKENPTWVQKEVGRMLTSIYDP